MSLFHAEATVPRNKIEKKAESTTDTPEFVKSKTLQFLFHYSIVHVQNKKPSISIVLLSRYSYPHRYSFFIAVTIHNVDPGCQQEHVKHQLAARIKESKPPDVGYAFR